LGEIWEVVIPGTCACAAEGAIERVTGPAGGLGDQVAIQIDGGRDGPMSSQRELPRSVRPRRALYWRTYAASHGRWCRRATRPPWSRSS